MIIKRFHPVFIRYNVCLQYELYRCFYLHIIITMVFVTKRNILRDQHVERVVSRKFYIVLALLAFRDFQR